MAFEHRVTGLIFAAVLLGCGTPSAPPPAPPQCTAQNCAALFSCRVQFGGEPNSRICRGADGGRPERFDFTQYCPAACDAQQGGAIAACAASVRSECEAALHPSAVFEQRCPEAADAGVELACADACALSRTACDDQCPLSSFQACMDCAASCGLTWAACQQGCG